jgi:uncharacterized membrane protein
MVDPTRFSSPSRVRLSEHPLHAMLAPIPLVLFMGTLLTDIAYWQTTNMFWADMSDWLLTVGVVIFALIAAAGLIDFLADRRTRERGAARIHVLGSLIALVLAIFNALIHTRDAYTSVVPAGLALSALVVLVLVVSGWAGGRAIYRERRTATEEVRR